MPRLAFTFLLILLVVGCQTTARGPQPTVLVNSSQPATPAQKFWKRTAQFFQPLLPDRGNRTAESDSHFATNRDHSDILPLHRTPHSLYKPGSIFPSPMLVLQSQTDNVSIADATVNVVPASTNPLQIQLGDSEAFRSLLREIAIMPPEKRQVDDERLEELLRAFRDEIMDTDFETEYLALLRRRILPDSAPLRNAAPLPSVTRIAGLGGAICPIGNPDLNDDDFYYDEPIVRQVASRTPPIIEEPIVAKNTMPMAGPVYPSLVQLPGNFTATVQASYQSQSVAPPTPNITGNITGHGAGDWQAPTRVAIEQLRYAIEQTPHGRTVSNEMRLRMLEMLLGNRSEAARPMQSADRAINDFMGHQVLGFSALFDDSVRDNRSRYVNAAYRFTEGLQELQNLTPIRLKNVMFVDDWIAYGQFFPRRSQEFYPGDEFLVYLEIDNPSVRRIPDGFEVSVSISYEIRDAHGSIVVREDMGSPSERSLSRKRDYALAFPATLPVSLAPGQYHLRISVTDLNDDSMQFAVAEEQIPLRVAPSLAAGR